MGSTYTTATNTGRRGQSRLVQAQGLPGPLVGALVPGAGSLLSTRGSRSRASPRIRVRAVWTAGSFTSVPVVTAGSLPFPKPLDVTRTAGRRFGSPGRSPQPNQSSHAAGRGSGPGPRLPRVDRRGHRHRRAIGHPLSVTLASPPGLGPDKLGRPTDPARSAPRPVIDLAGPGRHTPGPLPTPAHPQVGGGASPINQQAGWTQIRPQTGRAAGADH
jgi:hypothetical protein